MSIKSNNFNVTSSGNMTCKNANIEGIINALEGNIGIFNIDSEGHITSKKGDGAYINLNKDAIYFGKISGSTIINLATIGIFDTNSNISFLRADGNKSKLYVDEITAETYNNLSKESLKENFKKYKDALSVIMNSEIYTFNFKNKKEKKIGFVIPDLGGNFKTPDEVISSDKQGIELYTMSSIMWKAIQELNQKVEELENKLKEKEENYE